MSNQTNTSNNQPRTVQDIIRAIEAKSADGGYIYRGERKCYTKVSSNLYREYDINEEHFDIEVVQKEMLSDAKKHIGDLPQDFRTDFTTFPNVAEEDTDETINFEILTEIQHYGGKTNLIDFTTDYFIALFFACDGHHDKPGRVILQKTDEIQSMIKHPRNPRHRIIAQKSVFVRPPKGYIEPHEHDIVIIPANLKRLILQHLRTYHGISTETIYNDLYGFIRNQGIHGGAYTQFYKGFACQKRGNEATTSVAKQEQYKKSIEHYTEALKLNPQLIAIYYNRGLAYDSRGDFECAIQDFTKAIELKSDYADAYHSRGLAYGKTGDNNSAIEDFTKAIQLQQNDADAYYNRGLAYSKTGDNNSAIEDFTKAIALKPDFAEAYYNRGVAYREKGDSERAVEDFTKAIELKPNYAKAYDNRGVTYGNRGDSERAISDFTKAIELKPNFAKAYYNRGTVYGIKGDQNLAIEDFTKAIALKPDYAIAYDNRGNAYLHKSDYDLAISRLY